jgi:hypothetical protein
MAEGGARREPLRRVTSEARIEVVVQAAMLHVARAATAGGARVSLARVADRVFLELTSELERQGLTKAVIADMFGMALRTYHRRVQQVRRLQAERGTVRDAVLALVRRAGQVSALQVQQQFRRQPSELVAGALHDLVHAGFAHAAAANTTPSPTSSARVTIMARAACGACYLQVSANFGSKVPERSGYCCARRLLRCFTQRAFDHERVR